MKRLTMQSKTIVLCALWFLVLPTISFAGGSTCSTATAVIPDGRSLELDYAAPSSTVWYQFGATANRSYSVEVRDDLDPDNSDFTVLFYAAPVSCSSPVSNTNYTDTHLMEPVAGPHATRFSFVSSAAGAYYVSVQNTSNAVGHYVTVTVTETTLYSTNWSTYGNLNTTFAFQNTTSQPINYTLTVIATIGGTQTSSKTGTLGPISTPSSYAGTSTAPSDLNLAAQQAGNAIVTHNGPPGSVQGWALLTDYGTTPFTLVPIPFGPMRGK